MNRLITHLRHVDLAVPDYDRQREFYSGVWGLTEVANDSGISFLAAVGSPEQYIVRLRRADEKRLDLIAYGAATPADVDALAERLRAGGVRLIGEPGPLDTPGGGYGVRFFDIDGRTIEVSADVEDRNHRKLEEKESVPVRLSHVVVNTPNLDATRAWYEQHLDFALSDTLAGPHLGEIMHFMRCNPRHHSLAIAKGPHTSLHHISFEMRGIDEYMRGSGRGHQVGRQADLGAGSAPGGGQHLHVLPRPARQHRRVHHRAGGVGRGHVAPQRPRLLPPPGSATSGAPPPRWTRVIAKETFNEVDNGVFVAPPV